MRTAVVLPAPLGPSSAKTVAGGTSRSTPQRALTFPNAFSSPVATMAESGIPP